MLRKLFAYLYDRRMRRKEKTLLWPKRAELLWNISWKILEIWSGTWINFQYYIEQAQVTAIEPSVYMSEQSISRIWDKDIQIYLYTIAEYIEKREDKEGLFDYIVCTLVLCSIPGYESEIERLQWLLKPWWTLLVMEHILSTYPVLAYMQKLFTPIQKCLADGCHLDRQTDMVLKQSGMECISEEYFGRWDVFYVAKYRKK